MDYTFTPPGEVPLIGDHKTTSNIRYANKDLSQDIQATVYAAWGLNTFNTQKVRLKWGYVQTRKPYVTKPIEHVAEHSATFSRMKEIMDEHLLPMSRLVEPYKLKKGVAPSTEFVHSVVQNVAPTPDHCEAFGGCPYRAHCTDVGAGARLRSGLLSELNGEKMSGVSVDDILSQLGMTPAPKPAAAPAPDPVNPPVEEQAPQPTLAEVEEKKGKRGRPKKTDAAPAPEPAPATSRDPSYKLYIDCIPLDDIDAQVNTARMLKSAREAVEQQLNVLDFRMEGFGKGQGAFVAAVKMAAASGDFGRTFVVDSHTPEGNLVTGPLLELSGRNVVRGLR